MVCSEGLPKLPHHADGRGFTHFYPKTYYLKRGDVNAKQGESTGRYLQVLMRDEAAANDPLSLTASWKIDAPQGSRTSYRRRSLANWITDTDRGAGHLLARVIVNRLWQHHMGAASSARRAISASKAMRRRILSCSTIWRAT